MDSTIDVAIPVDMDAAKALTNPHARAAAGRVLSHLLKGHRTDEILAAAIAEAKQDARAHGLTDEAIDDEIRTWRAERTT